MFNDFAYFKTTHILLKSKNNPNKYLKNSAAK